MTHSIPSLSEQGSQFLNSNLSSASNYSSTPDRTGKPKYDRDQIFESEFDDKSGQFTLENDEEYDFTNDNLPLQTSDDVDSASKQIA